MSPQIEATLAIAARNTVGEAPGWDAAGGRLLWTDNAGGVVHEARLQASGWSETKRWSLGRPIAGMTPRAKEGVVIVAGVEIFLLNEAGESASFARLDADPAAVRFNDGKCDPQGRLWAGTTATDLRPGGGALYRIDVDGSVTTILEDVGMSNGCDWSPDGRTFYYVDSFSGRVDAFDFDSNYGTISNRRSVVTMANDEGAADGMTVDDDGCLWVAYFGIGEVRRHAPSGDLLTRVTIPTPAVTNCAFGGPGGAVLFITSAAMRLPDAFLPRIGFTAMMADNAASAAQAGGVFLCRPGPTGRPATPFAG